MLSVFLLLLTVVLLFIQYLTRNKNYWRKRGIFQVDGVVPQFMKEKCSLGEIHKDIYDKYPEQSHFGIFLGSSPTLMLKDLRDIEAVLESNFHCFSNRGIVTNPKEVLSDNLLFMNDYRRWKLMKHKLSSTFTNVKMRDMFHYVEKRVREFIDNMNENNSIKEYPFKALYAFATSILGASVFGIDDISQNYKDSPINDMIWNINDSSYRNNLIFYISNTYPKLFKLMNLKHFSMYNEYFLNIVKTVFKKRRDKAMIRHDIINTALELQKSGIMKDTTTGYEIKPTDEILASQAFLFYFGGVDNVAIVTHFTLLELGNNRNILEKLQKEIDNVFEECSGQITFDDIGKLEYLDMVISEVLRKYPAVVAIQRNCTADTTLPSTGDKVTKGTKIIIPTYALHRDKRYFPNPEKFDPERFSDENRSNIVKFTYLPFGSGNRRCFGMKFARLLLKFSLAWILRSFTVKEQIYKPTTFDPSFFSLKDSRARFELVARK